VTFDQYPYGAGATLLASLLPAWAQAGGAAATLERVMDAEVRRAIARDIRHGLPGWENLLGTLGPERIVVHGRTLAERGGDEVDTICELLLESDLAAPMILHYASDEAVRTIAAHPLQLVGSDGIFGLEPHPRLYGTAPRFLGRLAIREGLIPVEVAVARLTARAARRLGLSTEDGSSRACAPTSSCSTRRRTSTPRPMRRTAEPARRSASGSPGRPSSATAPSPAPAPAACSAAEPLARSPRRHTPDDDYRQHRGDECGDPVPEHDVDHGADGEHGGQDVESLRGRSPAREAIHAGATVQLRGPSDVVS
jgi:hypothetical protein